MTTPFPSTTYRLQLTSDFTLQDATEVLDYLADLGADAIYCSPLLTATSGSAHGYDWVDGSQVDPVRGGEAGWEKFVAKAKSLKLKVLVDIVPNHMGISKPEENPWWWDVLTFGKSSQYADFFDINWEAGRLIVPILGSPDATKDLTLTKDNTVLNYFEHSFPVCPGSYEPGNSAQTVHDKQHYQLVYWRDGNTKLNYRRFFAVTTLAGLKVENKEVFDASHERIIKFITEDGIEGLRVDHPDGLVDPGQYLEQLREAAGADTWLLVEKILEPGEALADWPVQGTTGYDAMTEVDQVFIDGSNEEAFTNIFTSLTGDSRTFREHTIAGRQMVCAELFTPEINRILDRLDLGSLSREDAALIISEMASRFPVYRSYLPDDLNLLLDAGKEVTNLYPNLAAGVIHLVKQLSNPANESARRFQQLTGAVMAKGVEDTAYYRYNRLICLNEVGGDPGSFGYSLDKFHQLLTSRQANQPRSMTALSTHDTKRGEDVRARISVLSEIPDEYAKFLEIFAAETEVPQPRFVSLMAQTLIGTGKIERQRLHDYFEKAMREAHDGTSWTDPDEAFEHAVKQATDAAFDNPKISSAWDDILRLVEQPGYSNSLSRKAVQLTMPGIPDVYQGTELWEDSLVDPDNRRQVDYAIRRRLLAETTTTPPVDSTGRAKLWITSKLMQLRTKYPQLFTGYEPLYASGEAADHLIGFNRGQVITLATRLPLKLARRGWGDTAIPIAGVWIDLFTGRPFTGTRLLSEIFDTYPVAVLVR